MNASVTAHAGGTIDYVGRSVLGPGDVLDISQGNYVSVGLSSGAKWRGLDFSAIIGNAADGSANRFAYGNPFTVTIRDQGTPQRPFSVRFGVSTAW